MYQGHSHNHAGDKTQRSEAREAACKAFLKEEPLITDHCTVILYRAQMELFEVVDDLEGLLYELDHALEDLVGHNILNCAK